MRSLLGVTITLVLLGCNQQTTPPASGTPNDRNVVSKPPVGTGEEVVLPTDQGNSQQDLAITAEIRQHILRNKQVSTSGRNVGVITIDGHVTLRGPVASADEHKMILQIAGDVAGVDKVTDHLEVSP